MLDLLITGGSCPDFGSGRMIKANIGIRDGCIAYVGGDRPESAKTLAAEGKIVSPGFIDIHMHEEDFAAEGERYVIAEMMLRMGVTTAVGGNCGLQRQSVRSFRQTIDKLGGSPVNYLLLAGYNQQRYALGLGRYEEATEKQRAQIARMIEQELKDGACGVSFGIEYDPGISTAEITDNLQCFADSNLLAAAHYRASCTKDVRAIEEMIEIAQVIPMKFQISHLSSCAAMGRMEESLALIAAAMDENERLSFDTYPYNAFSTSLGSEVFAPGCLERWQKDYDCILLTQEPYENVRCNEEIFRQAREKYPQMLAVVFAMNEEEIRQAVACRRGMIASDGIINDGRGHPRAAGTFPRVLGKYVREEKALSLIEALEKMTLRPAMRLALDKKGRIAKGCDADLVIFAADKIADKADFSDTAAPPAGIDCVLIGGRIAVKDNMIIDGRLGRFCG